MEKTPNVNQSNGLIRYMVSQGWVGLFVIPVYSRRNFVQIQVLLQNDYLSHDSTEDSLEDSHRMTHTIT